MGLIIIVRDSRGSPIIAHSELIICRDLLWMAATALLRASHLLALIHLQKPCFKEILNVLENIHAFVYYAKNVHYRIVLN